MILPKKTPISLLAKVVTFFRVIKKILTDILRPKNTLAMFLNGFQPKKRKKPLTSVRVVDYIKIIQAYGDIKNDVTKYIQILRI
jgi:hypothetical protein